MQAIDVATRRGWSSIWMETDSTVVVAAFHDHNILPWDIRKDGLICLWNIISFRFYVSHIFRKGNTYVNALAKYRLSSLQFNWWDLISSL